ncbi:MAG: DUF3592 domain-containing protein [Ilumatobacter sp.]|uniref:DUF3592 domain-containing protein n=1 Tax=Ilumatobacter sp. TaxID=1967498 RepID=UPI00391DEF50
MGFMKDIREMKKAAKDASAGFDPAAQMRAATAQMRQVATQQRVMTEGIAAPATVVAVRDSGAMINYQPVVDVDILIAPDGQVPWPGSIVSIGHGQLAGIAPGVKITVRYDPTDPSTAVRV